MIDEFLSEVRKVGLAKPNLFKVEITFPQQIRNGISNDFFKFYGITPRDGFRASLYCEATELPGRSIQSTPIKTHGPAIKVPYNSLYDDLPMTFYVGADMKEKKFFDAWQRMVADPVTGDLNYYKEYTTTIKIMQLEENGEEPYTIKLKEAWPSVISPVGLGHGEENTVSRLPVTFAYNQWELVATEGVPEIGGLGDLLLNSGPISNKLQKKLFDLRQLGRNQLTNKFDVVKGYANQFNLFK